MKTMDLYKYVGENGTIVSPVKLSADYEPMFRLVADNNKVLSNGETTTTVVDVLPNEVENWTEIDKPAEQEVQPPEVPAE